MKLIEATKKLHRQQRRIFLRFHSDAAMNRYLKSIPGARWSRTNKSWHVPDSRELMDDFIRRLPEGWRMLNPGEVLPEALPVKEAGKREDKADQAGKKIEAASRRPGPMPVIHEHNRLALEQMIQKLRLKGYSESTIRTYRQEFMPLLYLLRSRPVSGLTADEVKRYVLYCINELRLSENTIHSRLNALKFYFEQVLHREKIFVEIPRPKKPYILPKVLGEQEVSRLFRALDNKKHKALLFTAYSAGLRVSEAVSLKISNIDSDRMQILVERAKGKKDRYVMLSPVLLDILRNYLKTWKPRPLKYLFEGDRPGEPLSIRTAQEVFAEARRRAGLKKRISFHSLRHSFATHLLEQGIDIKYIKELLGHFSIHTTNRYLHVKKESLINIRSPLDEIYQSGDWEI